MISAIVVFAVFVFIIIVAGNSDGNKLVKAVPALIRPSPTIVNRNASTISLKEFNALKTGITYDEAVNGIGGEGTLAAQSEVGNNMTITTYQWDGEGYIGSSAILTFQNEKLTSKVQYGLK